MSHPEADFTVALSELRQVSDMVSQGADFFESQISEGLPVARCVPYAWKPSLLFAPWRDVAEELQRDREHKSICQGRVASCYTAPVEYSRSGGRNDRRAIRSCR